MPTEPAGLQRGAVSETILTVRLFVVKYKQDILSPSNRAEPQKPPCGAAFVLAGSMNLEPPFVQQPAGQIP